MRSILMALCLWSAFGAAAAPPESLRIAGEQSLNGIFDPSLEFAPGASEGWLAYSAVFGAVLPWGPHVETRLADAGRSTTEASLDDMEALWVEAKELERSET